MLLALLNHFWNVRKITKTEDQYTLTSRKAFCFLCAFLLILECGVFFLLLFYVTPWDAIFTTLHLVFRRLPRVWAKDITPIYGWLFLIVATSLIFDLFEMPRIFNKITVHANHRTIHILNPFYKRHYQLDESFTVKVKERGLWPSVSLYHGKRKIALFSLKSAEESGLCETLQSKEINKSL